MWKPVTNRIHQTDRIELHVDAKTVAIVFYYTARQVNDSDKRWRGYVYPYCCECFLTQQEAIDWCEDILTQPDNRVG